MIETGLFKVDSTLLKQLRIKLPNIDTNQRNNLSKIIHSPDESSEREHVLSNRQYIAWSRERLELKRRYRDIRQAEI